MKIAEKITLTNSQKTQLFAHMSKDIRVKELRKNQIANGGVLNALERIIFAQIMRETAQELGFIA